MRARLVSAAVLAAAVVVPVLAVAGPASAARGNDGTIKVAEVNDVGTESNDPHVACTFALEWYGFDAKAVSTVSFEAVAPTKDAAPTVVSGATTVTLEDDAAKGGTDLDGREIYTLSFQGEPQKNQGYHVGVTTSTTGSQGNDSKSKTFWVGPCETTDPGTTDPGTTDPGTTDPGTTDPGTTDPGTTDPGTTDPGTTDPGTTDPGTTDPGTTVPPVTTDPAHPTDAVVPWDWNWEYADPACDALTVDYPSNIPDGQANDVNIRVQTDSGPVTLNFHHNEGTWSGRTVFTYAGHPGWPADLTSYDVVWVQVGGTNYHWQGSVSCSSTTSSDDEVVEPAVTDVSGFRSGFTTLGRGATVAADTVEVEQAGSEALTLEQFTGGTWQVAKTVATNDRGVARVTYPRLTARGTYKFRLTVSQTISTTGDTTGVLTVRVR
ncbi:MULTISPECIES: hypothetical protein [unclassified Nocardioides]|uniref:hypothetical protein n=1 Tax=unclassified Nocardioides TaxID=2615069 RepID=UPI0009EFF711|nr:MULTISPECIES: hypothetical protein [unclassified Nocardioides]GAW52241.1 uncharacterized protein (Precursor) [Nocardioides sp. PD653-B2]GAW56074.1 uncharacterized protein (Precursor) [Nocardioides sp. PD653]